MILLDMTTIMEEIKAEKETHKHVQGRPWKVEAKFKDYSEAQQFRLELEKLENPPIEIKIKHMSSNGLFIVKTRNLEDKKTKKKK